MVVSHGTNIGAVITFLVDVLCAPVSGAQPKLASACQVNNTAPYPTGFNSTSPAPVASATATGTPTGEATVPFTGEGMARSMSVWLLAPTVLVVMLVVL